MIRTYRDSDESKKKHRRTAFGPGLPGVVARFHRHYRRYYFPYWEVMTAALK
jgi:hypothetical protein